jgi:hypothetical protein
VELISRPEALARELKYYFTGNLCKRGHISMRQVSNHGCVECNRTKARDHFATPTGQQHFKEVLQPYRKTKDGKAKTRQAMLRYCYDMSIDEYNIRIKTQQHCCIICKQPFVGTGSQSTAPTVDHCHTTNKVRGILCHKCNSGIGMLNDDITLLQNAVKYLTEYKIKQR